MSDLNWCTRCDTAISHYSDSLYCSEDCLRVDALRNHPLLGYDWQELVDFPRPYSQGKRAPLLSSTFVSMQQSLIAAPLPEVSSDSTRSIATSFWTSLRTPPSSSFLSSSRSSPPGSPALTACSTLPSSPSSYSSALPPSKFDMLSLTADTNRKQPKPIRPPTSLLFTSTTLS